MGRLIKKVPAADYDKKIAAKHEGEGKLITSFITGPAVKQEDGTEEERPSIWILSLDKLR